MAGAGLAVSIFAIFVTCVGWYINSRLNAHTQRQALINSITNDARIILTDAIRDFHEWCDDIQPTATMMHVDDITSLGQTNKHHEERKQKLIELSLDSQRYLTWLRRLEEYEPLFPGTAIVRVELLHLLMKTCDFARQLAEQHTPGSPPPQNDRERFNDEIYDLLALTWDLLLYLQNVSIGQITGNKIPLRKPEDVTCVRLIADKRDYLTICRPKQQI